jgi:cyclopropane fatty-acyl-phospholipid synthase-like methyltransferase
MKRNRIEKGVVNNAFRVMLQRMETSRFLRMAALDPGATILKVGCGRGAGTGSYMRYLRATTRSRAMG